MKNAFTLIEMLVVIAIIGMLAAIIIPNLNSARERSRDVTRKNDIRAIQKALELYKLDNKEYIDPLPSAGGAWVSTDGLMNIIATYMKMVPTDPLNTSNAAYQYYYDRNGTDTTLYSLCACLENNADPDGVACNAPCGSCPTTKCYMTSEP